MNSTLKLLKPFVDEDLCKLSYAELSKLYIVTNDTRILASTFKNIFNLAISVKNEFWGLSEEDVASYCLEKLDYCLRTYNPKYAFTTYFVSIFRSKLRTETESLNLKKRKCILESINDLIEIGIEDTHNLIQLLLPSTLTKSEYVYCMLASEGYDNKYIAEQLNVSRMTISNIRKSLRIKLNGLQD